jgi:hypothetical protein
MKVRTTFRPDEEVEVTEGELLDLRRQGLLAEDPEKKAEPSQAKATEKKEG